MIRPVEIFPLFKIKYYGSKVVLNRGITLP